MENKIMPKRLRDYVLSKLKSVDERMRQTDGVTFRDIYYEMQDIMRKQEGFARKPSTVDRAERLSNLLQWAVSNRINCSRFTIAQYSSSGFGLMALENIKKGEKFVEIPKKLIFSTNSFFETEFGLMVRDLQFMPGVKLALAILAEINKPNSLWKAYFDSLPDSYIVPLYFTPEDVDVLAETSVVGQVLKFYQLVIEEYFKIFEIMEKETNKKKLKPMKNFCFSDFRWALATALTRENRMNQIAENGIVIDSVLIPLWDMCNHAWANEVSTFVQGSGTIISEAIMDFKKGAQIFMHYGYRDIKNMFLYGGYVIPDAPNAKFSTYISLSIKDELYKLKMEAFDFIGIKVPFILEIGAVLTQEGLAFARIFCMKKEMLSWFLENPQYLKLLKERRLWVSQEHEIATWNFLSGRCVLLERSFKKSLEEDIESLDGCKTETLRLIYQLRIVEKRAVRRFANFCQDHLSYLAKCTLDFDSAHKKLYGSSKAMKERASVRCPLICIGPQCPELDDRELVISMCCHLDEPPKWNFEGVPDRYLVGFERMSEKSVDEVVRVLGECNLSLDPDEAKEVAAATEPSPGGKEPEQVDESPEVIVEESPVVVIDESPEEINLNKSHKDVASDDEVIIEQLI